MSKKKKKKRKLSKKKIFIFVFIILFIIYIIKIFNTNITNIYISGNIYLTDQQIIDISKLNNYPNTMNNISYKIEKKLEENLYITNACVRKNILYITIEENYPLLYDNINSNTIFFDGQKINEKKNVPVLVSKISNEVHSELIKKIKEIDLDILNRISEIEYRPIEIKNDENSMHTIEERFLLIMNDGNHVYISLNKFDLLNKYLDIIKYFNGEKGVLNLDSGGYFDVFD